MDYNTQILKSENQTGKNQSSPNGSPETVSLDYKEQSTYIQSNGLLIEVQIDDSASTSQSQRIEIKINHSLRTSII